MDSATLTFTALNARIDALPDHESLSVAPSRRQRWGYAMLGDLCEFDIDRGYFIAQCRFCKFPDELKQRCVLMPINFDGKRHMNFTRILLLPSREMILK